MSLPRYPEYKDSGVEWLGSVPAHWEVDALRRRAALNPSKAEVRAVETEKLVSFLPMEAVGERGDLDLSRTRRVSEVLAGYTYFREGDIAFAKITPCFENGKGARMVGLRGGFGFGTTELTVVRPDPDLLDGHYLDWVLRSVPFRKRGEAAMYGAGGQKRVPDEFVREFVIGWPDIREQSLIAKFLDRETGRIDALLAEQEKLLALLVEKRQATISHAVTRGLDPNVPMKDSGVAWLGEVPAHWRMMRIKALSCFTTSGPRGWSERISEEGSLFIQSGDLNEVLGLDLAAAKRVDVGNDVEAARTRLRGGDVVVCITGAKTGNVAFCPPLDEPAYVNQHICLIRPIEQVDGRFLAVALKSDVGRTQFDLAQYGLKQGLSLENVRELCIALPPPDEQQAILDFIEGAMSKLSSLAETASAGVVLLKERRSALISAAVTGQIDVRELVGEAA